MKTIMYISLYKLVIHFAKVSRLSTGEKVAKPRAYLINFFLHCTVCIYISNLNWLPWKHYYIYLTMAVVRHTWRKEGLRWNPLILKSVIFATEIFPCQLVSSPWLDYFPPPLLLDDIFILSVLLYSDSRSTSKEQKSGREE